MQPWFKFYAADYLLDDDVFSLKPEAVGLLLAMWCLCWRDGYAPADPAELSRKTRLRARYVVRHLPSVVGFFTSDGRSLRSPRMDQERSESVTKSALKSSAGKTGARHRWSKETPANTGNADAVANADANGKSMAIRYQSQSQRKANTSARSRAPQKKASPNDILQTDDNRRAFWDVVDVFGAAKCPRPRTAAESFMAALERGASPLGILDAARRYRESVSDAKYLVQLAGWLDDSGYDMPYQNAPQRPTSRQEAIPEPDTPPDPALIPIRLANLRANLQRAVEEGDHWNADRLAEELHRLEQSA